MGAMTAYSGRSEEIGGFGSSTREMDRLVEGTWLHPDAMMIEAEVASSSEVDFAVD